MLKKNDMQTQINMAKLAKVKTEYEKWRDKTEEGIVSQKI